MATTASATWTPPSEFAEQLDDLYGLTCPPRWGTPRNPLFPTFGPKAAKVMQALGYRPMPWQRYALDVGLEVDPATGLFVYRKVGLSVPRQQGKTQLLLAVIVHRLMAWARQHVLYSAQTRTMARKRFEDEFVATLELSRLAKRFRKRMQNGQEAVIWTKTRSVFGITSNTESAAHGPPLDLGVMDEIFAHIDDRVEQAMSPAQISRMMAQLWWASAGGTDRSHFLNAKRAAGREAIQRYWECGERPDMAYFEWYPDDRAPRDQPSTWYTCLPALGLTVTEAVIRTELGSMKPAEFDRAYLNRTKKATAPADDNVPIREWPSCVDSDSTVGDDFALALDVAPAGSHASIGLAGPRADGLLHLELVDYRPGTDWVVEALLLLAAVLRPVCIAIDSKGPVGALLVDLQNAGFKVPTDPAKPKRGELWIPSVQDIVQGCGGITNDVRQDKVRHIGQEHLDTAIGGTRSRPLGDAYAWARRASAVDISPWVAVTNARQAYLVRRPLLVEDYDIADSFA